VWLQLAKLGNDIRVQQIDGSVCRPWRPAAQLASRRRAQLSSSPRG
jgi:hypothetical protein